MGVAGRWPLPSRVRTVFKLPESPRAILWPAWSYSNVINYEDQCPTNQSVRQPADHLSGSPVTVNTNRLQLLIAYLILHGDKAQPRERLAFFAVAASNESQARTICGCESMRITERYRRRDFGHMERLPSMTPNTTRVPSPSRLDRVISDSDVLECVVPRMRRTAFTCSSVGMAVGFAQSGNSRFGAAVSLEPESINALGSLNCADSRRAGNYGSMCLAGSRSKARKDWRRQLPPFERGREENRRGLWVQAGLKEPLSGSGEGSPGKREAQIS